VEAVDSKLVDHKFPQPKKPRHTESKGLTNHRSGAVSLQVSAISKNRAFVRRSADSARVVLQSAEGNGQRLAQSKGLTDRSSAEPLGGLSGLVARRKRGEGYLLIPQVLMANSLRKTGEGLLNLKDLLSVFPASRRTTFSALAGPLKCDGPIC
jgi:hypothetical protein